MAVELARKVCLVTGASRGVGRGVALGLLETGATVHITGRTLRDGEHPENLDRAGSLASVLAEAGKYPGRCVAHRVDHGHDAETEGIVRRVLADEGRLDILVNSAWGGYERMVQDGRYTWEDLAATDVALGRDDGCRRPLLLVRYPQRRRGDGAAAFRPDRQHLVLGRAKVHAERRLRRLEGRHGQDGA